MARLLGPDANGRLVYVASSALRSAAGQTATVYAAASGSTLANIATYDGTDTPGAVIVGSTLTVDQDSLLPRFWFPDGVDTVYVEVSGGTRVAVNADYDARLDALRTQMAMATPAVITATGQTEFVALTVVPAVGDGYEFWASGLVMWAGAGTGDVRWVLLIDGQPPITAVSASIQSNAAVRRWFFDGRVDLAQSGHWLCSSRLLYSGATAGDTTQTAVANFLTGQADHALAWGASHTLSLATEIISSGAEVTKTSAHIKALR